jgi:hypothetical protein
MLHTALAGVVVDQPGARIHQLHTRPIGRCGNGGPSRAARYRFGAGVINGHSRLLVFRLLLLPRRARLTSQKS